MSAQQLAFSLRACCPGSISTRMYSPTKRLGCLVHSLDSVHHSQDKQFPLLIVVFICFSVYYLNKRIITLFLNCCFSFYPQCTVLTALSIISCCNTVNCRRLRHHTWQMSEYILLEIYLNGT